MELQKGVSYLFVSPNPDKSYDEFKALIAAGSRGLCLSRNNPDVVREKHGLTCPIVWLARTEEMSEKYATINPEHILKIHTAVTEFLRSAGESVILMDCLEYLVVQNDFTSILKLLSLLNERVAISRARLIIPINPNALEPKQVGLLERECTRLDVL